MGEEVYIVAIVFGSIVTIVTLGIVGSIIKSWVKNRPGSNLADNEEFLEALRQFKQKTDRRLSNLEAIVIDDEPPARQQKSVKSSVDHKSIEIDDQKEPGVKSSDGNLKNMLKE
jgi:hypothetical protein